MNRRQIIYAFMPLVFLALISTTRAQENWPQWRGPNLSGVGSSTNLPTTWSAEQNIAWKTELPSWSAGTPIIWGDQVFVTSPSKADPTAVQAQPEPPQEQGRRRRRRDPGGSELMLICLSKRDGALLWQHQLDEGNKTHRKGNNTSPSPVTDGNHVWVVTGNGVVTALDMKGNKKWRQDLQKEYGTFGHNWGYASSPLLYEGKLIVEVLHGMRTDDPSYVVAFDAAAGKVLWRQERPTDAIAESPDAYTTPAVLRHDGKSQIVITGGDYVTGHDPETGKELWRAGGLNPEKRRNYRIVASPMVVDGIIYAPTRKKPLLALDAAEPNSSPLWKWDGPAATDVPTPICDGKYFYMVDDRGMVVCLDAKSGEVVWGPERTAQGIVSSSPILADGKLYIINEQAITTVLAAGSEFKILSTNELDGSYTLASPAVSNHQLFLRTANHLYCIEETD
ncbi:PQQ-binding-like beta-propeller repeat protein [bacterium]|nr:PQQ-binding-like beta-propeller repeat protein [bacterium]